MNEYVLTWQAFSTKSNFQVACPLSLIQSTPSLLFLTFLTTSSRFIFATNKQIIKLRRFVKVSVGENEYRESEPHVTLVSSQIAVFAKGKVENSGNLINIARGKAVIARDPAFEGTSLESWTNGEMNSRNFRRGLFLDKPRSWAQVDLADDYDVSKVVFVASSGASRAEMMHVEVPRKGNYFLQLLDANGQAISTLPFRSHAVRSGDKKEIYTFTLQ